METQQKRITRLRNIIHGIMKDKKSGKQKGFRFLNVEFDYGTINFNNTEYLTTIQTDSTTRYVYYIIPFEFEGTLSTYITNNTITNNQFFIIRK